MNATWQDVRFADFLRPNSRPYTLGASEDANLVGMRLYGVGPFHRELKPAMQIVKKTHFVIRAGDVIFNKLFAWKGTFGIVPPELDGMFVSDKFPTYELDRSQVDADFLRWYFRCPPLWEQARAMSTGSAALSKLTLNPPKFLLLTMPRPPLAEQRRVVARIEGLAAQVQSARDLRAQASDEAEALWQRGAERTFDRLAAQHPARCLSELVTIRGGGTPSKLDPAFWDGGIPWITPKDMKARELSDAIDHVSERAVAETPAKLIPVGAVLVVVRGMILAHTVPAAVLRASAAVNQDMKALVPSRDLLPEFLCSFLWANNSRVLDLVEKSTHDTRKLETQKLLNVSLPFPPPAVQRRIVAELDALRTDVGALTRLQSETAAELDALLPAVLHRAFKGEL